MVEKRKVRFTVQARYQLHGEAEMTEAEFEEWCQRIDGARGFDRERVADDLIELCGLDRRDGDLDDEEVEDFDWLRE